jgi:peroxiredoxin
MSIDTVTTIKGTPMNVRYQEVDATHKILNNKMFNLQKEYGELLKTGELTPEKQAQIDLAYDENMKDITGLFFSYAKENMKNRVGEFIFRSIAGNLGDEQLRELLALAQPDFKENEDIQRIENQITALENTAVGKPFVDLKAQTPEGNDIALSDFAGKGTVVLLDFWASWCGPCIQEMPVIAEAYRKYKNKGLEIVGISLDKDSEAWMSAIKQHRITWLQMSDLKAWESDLSAAYGVNAIPHTVLLDRDGTIIAKNLRGDALLSKLDELLK